LSTDRLAAEATAGPAATGNGAPASAGAPDGASTGVLPASPDGQMAAGGVQASRLRIAFALALVYVLWGGTYLGMRLAIATIPPFLMAGTRYLCAGAILYAFARLRGAAPPRPVHWRSAAIVGLLLLAIGNGGVVWSEQRVSSGMAALLICSEPMWIVIFAWLRRNGRRPGPGVVAGLLLGFAGLALLVRPAGGAGTVDRLAAAALLAASVSWAGGSIYVQRAVLPRSPLLTTAMQMLCGGGMLLATGLLSGEPARLHLAGISASSALAMLYLVVCGSLIGFTAYTWLLRAASPVLVSTYAYVNPVVAVLLGWALVHEPVTGATLAGAVVILSGVALITRGAAAESPPPPRREPAPTHQGPSLPPNHQTVPRVSVS
jgi:drug/metabolite transporter (DMT)-like permease